MLTFSRSTNISPGLLDCSGLSRRDFLRVGTLGLGGLSLAWLLTQKARAEGGSFLRNKSIVYLFLSGGASHIETFHPNMDAPAPYCSVTGDVQTSVPGLALGGTFPRLARHADKMAIVRSFQHPIGGHVQAIVHMLTGGTDPLGMGTAGFGMGPAFARLRGANHPITGMPTSTLLVSDEVDPQYRNERGRVEKGSRPNSLGSSFAPFNPAGGGEATANLKLNLDSARFNDRRSLLAEISRQQQLVEQHGDEITENTQQAFDLLLGSASEAFDLSREDPRLVERYDTSGFQIGKKIFRPSDLGTHFMTARRLIEAGCGFVTIHSAGWDMHADGNNPGIERGMRMLGAPVDKAVSAFVEDLDDRGMLDDVLIVIGGDFGRTPKINSRGGRDHWANLCPLAFIGGGIGRGQIIGQSARRNDVPVTEPVLTSQIFGTVMHTLFDVAQLRLTRGVPRDLMQLLESAQPIPDIA
ncbi:DUF1501 domain-containing protein [bacterium]|nr:DUF1501 domain-containing protein [bacterium]